MSFEPSRSYSFSYDLPWEAQNRDEIFKGPLADWAKERRELYLEIAEPIHLYFGTQNHELHTAAWMFRHMMDQETGSTQWMFHVACDCMPLADGLEMPDLMFGCEVMAEAVIDRVVTVGVKFQKSDVGQAVVDILGQDQRDPKTWVANYLNGQHEISILALMLGRDPEEVEEVAYDLSEHGLIDIQGDTLRLVA